MADDIENGIRDLRERLISVEVESRSERRWLVIVGILLLGLLGYTNFIALPNEVTRQLPDVVTRAVDEEAPKRVNEAFAKWVSNNNGGAILDGIRSAQSEVSSIKARAVADGSAIQAILQQEQNVEVGDNGCRITGGLQLCWGRNDLVPNGVHTRAFAIRFKSKFAGKPIITDSIKANGKGEGFAFAIYDYELTEETFTGNIVDVDKKPNNVPVEFSYIAIGRPGKT
jgi:hypothetical protein